MLVSKKNQQQVDIQITDHLMIDLETMIVLIALPCIVDLGTYELHPGDEKKFNKFIDEC